MKYREAARKLEALGCQEIPLNELASFKEAL
jgi:hypothetical protein